MPSPLPLEPRLPCPQVFANEPFHRYPPCPSFETLQAISPETVKGVVSIIAIVTIVLIFLVLVTLTLTMATGE